MPPKARVLTDKEIEKIEAMSGMCLTLEEIGILLDIPERTFRRIKARDKRVMAAYKSGFLKQKLFAKNKLWWHIKNGCKSSLYFWLKCQAGYRETNKIEVEEVHEKAEAKATNKLKNLSTEELKELKRLASKVR